MMAIKRGYLPDQKTEFKRYSHVKICEGYKSNRRTILFECGEIRIGKPKLEWMDEETVSSGDVIIVPLGERVAQSFIWGN